ncbi:hypothetical protein Peur_061893 [Populus x canadensis]
MDVDFGNNIFLQPFGVNQLKVVAINMDIISQLQEQVNQIAALTFNTFGTLQKDALSVRLSQNFPEPPPNPTEDAAIISEQP